MYTMMVGDIQVVGHEGIHVSGENRQLRQKTPSEVKPPSINI